MDDTARARLAALIDSLDIAAAARVDTIEPVVMLGLGTIVGAARNDPDWLYDQLGRGRLVLDALSAWVDRGELPTADVPDLLREAIEAAAAPILIG